GRRRLFLRRASLRRRASEGHRRKERQNQTEDRQFHNRPSPGEDEWRRCILFRFRLNKLPANRLLLVYFGLRAPGCLAAARPSAGRAAGGTAWSATSHAVIGPPAVTRVRITGV